MMVANSSNLIITFKPANQRTLTSPRRGSLSRTSQLSGGSHHTNQTNTSEDLEPDEQDEIVDLTGVTLDENTGSTNNGSGCANGSNGGGVGHLTPNTAQMTINSGSGNGNGSGSSGNGSGIIESHDGVLHL